MFDASFWVATAFIVFVWLVRKPVGRVFAGALDGRRQRIEKELNEARRLKEEAQGLLTTHQRDQRQATEAIEAIIQNAKDEAQRIVERAKVNLEKDIKRRTELAEQKIAQAEDRVIQQLRDNAVDITTSAARALIMENLSRELAEEIISSAVSDINRKLH